MTEIVPLFPLNIVLFPGMELPLHIFEDRYRLMIDRCLEGDKRFAVGLIRAGQEVAGLADPYKTGTVALISDVARYSDGRMNILVTGSSRFEILDMVEGEQYYQARIKLLPDPAETVSAEIMARARQLFVSYIEVVLTMANLPLIGELPDDPAAASYTIARMLQTDLFTKQALLEMPGAGERLNEEIKLLEKDTERMKAFSDILEDRAYFYHRGNRYSKN